MNELLLEKRRYGLKEEITPKEQKQLDEGVPVQKIIGFIDFDDLKIKVNKNVLIPRYETQEVVIKAMEFIREDSKVLDMCGGSGYIGLTIKQKTNADVTLVDISDEAIEQMNINSSDNNLDVNIVKSDMFKAVNGLFDVLVSNPPYIPSTNKLSNSVMEHDPHLALFGGTDGNDFYKILVEQGFEYLNEGGVMVLEISDDNSEYILSQGFEIFLDINGKDRIAVKRK